MIRGFGKGPDGEIPEKTGLGYQTRIHSLEERKEKTTMDGWKRLGGLKDAWTERMGCILHSFMYSQPCLPSVLDMHMSGLLELNFPHNSISWVPE